MTTQGIIICPTTCWACKFDHHESTPHPWWDDEDVYFAQEAGDPLPSGYCGCYCSRIAVKELLENSTDPVLPQHETLATLRSEQQS